MDERYRLIINIVTKKIGYILLCGIICAGLLLIEKAFFTDFHVQTGTFMAETVMVVQEDPKGIASKQKINYPALIRGVVNVGAVIKELEEQHRFDFTKMVYNWERLSDLAKIKWVQTHTMVYPNGNIYTFVFCLNKKELIDLEFLQQNVNLFLNIFIKNSVAYIQKAKPKTAVTLIGTQLLYPKEVDVKKSDTLFKYGIIGFVLGAVLASLVVIVHSLRGYHND